MTEEEMRVLKVNKLGRDEKLIEMTKPILTQRQIEVLQYVEAGYTSKMIANALGITERTINEHVKNIIQRLKAENRQNMISIAIRMGLL